MNYSNLRSQILAAIKYPPQISAASLQEQLINIVNGLDLGALLLGVATPSLTPNTEANGFYFALQSGTYTNFPTINGQTITVDSSEVAIIVRSGNYWSKIHITTYPTIDPTTKHWMIGNKDTGVLAEGQPGQPGQSAVNPFKGWYNSLAELKAAHTAIEGDSAYVKDASPATTWSIYVYDATATANNNWVDSGLDADTSNVQTFASGEEVNETHIDETGLVSPILGSLAKAGDAMQLKSTLQCSTLEETKAEFVLGNGYIDHNGAVSGSTTNAHAEIVIPSGYDSIRFLGLMTYTRASSINYCIAFYNSNDVAIKTIRYLIKPDSPAVKNEYIVAIPEGATKFKCSMAAANRNTFYCYFRKGKSVGDNIDGVVDEVHQEFYDLAQVTDVVVINRLYITG